MFAQKLKCILLYKIIVTLKNYPCTVSLLSNVNWSAFLEDFLLADPVMSQLREWRLWREPIRQPRPGTAAIAPWTSPQHGKYIVAIPDGHSYSKGSVWKVYPPPSPSLCPTTLPPLPIPPTPIPCWPKISAHLKKLSQSYEI